MKPIYPQIPRAERKNTKVTDAQHDEIVRLRKAHLSVGFLAKKFHLDPTTINYHTSALFRRVSIDKSTRASYRAWEDPPRRKIIIAGVGKLHKERLKTDQDFREYVRSLHTCKELYRFRQFIRMVNAS